VIDDDIRTQLSRSAVRQMIQDLSQLAEPNFGGSTTAARVLREANGGLGFGRHGRSVPAGPETGHQPGDLAGYHNSDRLGSTCR
jgi:hypothetical protein